MIPVNLKIKNFFSHKDTELDFTKFNAGLLIGNIEGDYSLSNGSGKSAIFEAILWCLFNKARAAPMDDIIMWTESDCFVEFEFIHNSEKYKIERTRSRVTGISTVNFYIDENGTWKEQSGSTSKITNAKITNTICVDYKTFINSAYFRQDDISEFAKSDAGRKKDILKSIIDISKWDEYEKNVKLDVKIHKQACTLLSIEVDELKSSNEDLTKATNRLNELSLLVEKTRSGRDSTNRAIETLSNNYSKIKQNIDTNQWDNITNQNKILLSNKKTLASKNSSIKKEIASYDLTIKNLRSQISDNESILSGLKTDENAASKLAEKISEKKKIKVEINSSQERLDELNDINIISGSCYICGQEVSDTLSDALHKEHNDKVSLFKKRIVFGGNKINEVSVDISDFEKKAKDTKRAIALSSSISSWTDNLNIATSHRDRIVMESEHISKEICEASERIESNEEILKSLRSDDFNELKDKIKNLKSKKLLLQEELESANRELGVYTQKVVTLKKDVEKLNLAKEKLKKSVHSLLVFDKLSKLLGKNGIQTILLNAVIEDLESTSNGILRDICNEPFEIILETQRVGSDGISIVDTLDLKVKKGGFIQNFKSLSGGEQFRISLALRIGMSEVSSKHGGSSLEFLLLDEINSPLDRHGTENLFVNVIHALELKYKILVITHDDLLKEKFDNIIDVTKINGESVIKTISK
jgi:DNA repair exonuclease SbcCD ATPase subunit